MPFRDAHHITGRIVKLAEDKGVGLDALSLAEMQSAEPRISECGVFRAERGEFRREPPQLWGHSAGKCRRRGAEMAEIGWMPRANRATKSQISPF